MADGILIKYDAKDVRQIIAQLPEGAVKRAQVRMLNKVAANTRTAASRAIRTRRALTAGAVNKAITIRRATAGRLQSSLVVTGRPIPLRDYKARQNKRGVAVTVTPGPRKIIRGAFIAPTLSNQVFKRTGKSRLPIEKLYGPSLPSTFLQAEVKLAWITVANEAMVKRGAEEFKYELSKLRRRG